MNFRRLNRTHALSDCGNYEIRIARGAEGRPFHNAWHIPSGKHIDASYDREHVKRACREHAEKQGK